MVFAVLFPITAFVASGFEHSIANMYFIPLGLLRLRRALGDEGPMTTGKVPRQEEPSCP